jgi:hypothetical protein
MSHLAPIVDPGTASAISAWALYGWPIAVTGLVLLKRWRHLESRFAFALLGYLTCTGVGAFTRQFGFTVFWLRVADQTPGDIILVKLVNASLSIAIFGAIVSVAPVLWLSRLLKLR